MTRNETIKWFAELNKSAIAIAGGKGANLGELARTEIPVPPGFVITTQTYDAFVASNQLQAQIIDLATQTQMDDPASFEVASEKIQTLFMQGVISGDLATKIERAYGQLTRESGRAIAVRSSATAEDLPTASFAGQQDTYLNVQGDRALLEAVKKCWASLWTARAISYRMRQDIDPAGVSLAVVVQQLILADSAGILFTANPINGQREQILINATWGLGEAIVGGQVTPDTVVLDKLNWQILSRETATKTVMTVRTDEGTEEQPVPQAQQNQPVLDDVAAIKLARYGAQIEAHYDMPMDIEWALAEGKIAVLQARPITSLPEPQLEPPTEWNVPDPEGLYYRAQIVEQLPNPLSPLFATLGGPAIAASLHDLTALFLGVDKKAEEWLDFPTINGYGYYHMRNMGRILFGSIPGIFSVFPILPKVMTGEIVDKYWRNEYHPRYAKLVKQWQTKPIGDLSANDLLAGIAELLSEGTRYYASVQMVMLPAKYSETSLTGFYNRLVKREDDPQIVTFMLGFDSMPINAEKSLYDLAMWSRQHETLTEALANTPSAQLTTLFLKDQPLNGADPAEWDEWRRRFQSHLNQFGHMIYDLDFISAVPNDDPAPLIETLKFHVQGKSVNPHKRQQESIANREQAVKATLDRLDPIRRRLFKKLLNWAHTTAPTREDALADLGLAWPLMRQMAFELGRRLVAVGAIEQVKDTFWLEADEVRQAAAKLDAGQTGIGNFAGIIRHRKALMKAQQRVTPPPVLPKGARMFGLNLENWMPAKYEDTQTGNTIEGIGSSPGQVTATARVLYGPEDFSKMQPGDVLVAGITTPAWTPLFALASAVVTDVGGVLSHSSIVAREYGIPAVLGTGVATKRIQSGQRIQVDGDAGTVTLLDEANTDSTGETETWATGSRAKKAAFVALAAGAVIGLVVWWRKRKQHRLT